MVPRFLLLAALLAIAGPSPAATGTRELAWEEGPGLRRLALAPAADAPGGFARLDPRELGIAWTNRCSPARYSKRQNLMNGAGLALGDFDGDGWCDLYLCNREGANALYRNLGGWRFVDVTDRAGVAATHQISSGALFADFNGDGRLDLHVTSFLGPDTLFLNRGDGTFTNATAAAGVASPGGGTSSAAADLDGDGDLDLYVARFAVEALLRDGSAIATRMVGGQPVVTGRAGRRIRIIDNRLYELGEPDLLFFNQGDGRFTPGAWPEHFIDEDGQPWRDPPADLGFTVQLRDINGDGHPDIYVCNDFQTPDRVWLGDGRGRFRPLDKLALRNMSYASMGVDFADIDRDGHLDFYTLEMLPGDHFRHLTHVVRGADPSQRQPRNPFLQDAFSRSILAWNRGDGSYAEIAWFAGTATSDWSWTPIFLDVDLDGFEDLIISSGYPHDVNHLDFAGGAGRGEGRRFNESFTEELLRYPPLDAPHIAWRNRGDRTFEDRSEAWHFNFRVVTHGLALADLDNDGDLDVVGNSFNAPPLICRNDAPAPRIAVRPGRRTPAALATGARLRLLGGPVPVQEQEWLAGGRYLACDQQQRTFAAAPARGPLTLEIRWRDGRLTTLRNVQPNCLYEIDAGGAAPAPAPAPLPAAGTPLLEPVTLPAGFTHADPPADELARQPLLPWRQGFQGPGLLWRDADPGGANELLLGAGREGQPRSIRVGSGAVLQPSDHDWGPALPDDGLGLLGVTLQPGRPTVLVAVANYETGRTNLPSVRRWDLVEGAPTPGEPLPGSPSSPGALAAGDFDGDGDLDVVVAGRMISGRYPEPADTRLFRNDGGRLLLDADASQPLTGAGLVSGALFADLDGDGRPELVLACEWGALRVFGFDRGLPRERTAALGLDRFRGVWQSITTGDFDGDGRLDLAAGNWGRNSYQQRAPAGPWQLVYAALGGDSVPAIIESVFLEERRALAPLRPRDTLAAGLPWLPALFPRHADYARATIPQLLGEHAALFKVVEATTLASCVLLNRGDHFEPRELPGEAQWTPVFGLAAADFDGDGDDDLFCAQNFFAVRDEEDRLDAGLGLLLRNDGHAAFTAVPAAQSGIRLLGEQRGVAIADFNRDGRVDLAVAQNSGPVALLVNRAATPGLRVRLSGTAANPDAIGARLRLEGDGWSGPAREVTAGAGHLSQHSLVQVLGGRDRARRLWVRFPGQAPHTHELPAGITEITAAADGTSHPP